MRRASSRRGGPSALSDGGEGSSSRPTRPENPEQPPAGFQPHFEFVEGLKSKAQRKKTRSFVTTQHYRRKRYEERQVQGDRQADPQGKGKGRRSSTPDQRRNAADEGQTASELLVSRFNQTSSLRQLGGGRADPFNSYPVPATRDVHELVDHFYFVIPSLIHRYWQRAARRPRACWELFNLYRMHEIPFLGMLHHAAHHLASMKGEQDSLQVIEFKTRSLTAINKRLQNTNGPCDNWTLVGVGLLANAERIWGDREIARMHWGALKRLLVERGGFPALKDNPAMHTKLVWSFIALSWPTATENLAYVDGFVEMTAATLGSPQQDPHGAFLQSCQEFLQFFNTRKSQALKSLPSTVAQQRDFRTHRYRTTMFQEDSELWNALKPSKTNFISAEKQKAVDNCRMACLIHLNLILADYGDFSQSTEGFLKDLQRILDEADDDSTLTAEHLLWTLLGAFPPKEHYERIWKTTRLVGVSKRVRSHTRVAIENALRLFLRLPETIGDLEAAVSGWDREEFLREVQRVTERTDGIVETYHEQFGHHIPCSGDCQVCGLNPTTA